MHIMMQLEGALRQEQHHRNTLRGQGASPVRYSKYQKYFDFMFLHF
jgi:hypothetical protein